MTRWPVRAPPGRHSPESAENHPGAQHDRRALESAPEPAHPGPAADSPFGDPRGQSTNPRPDRCGAPPGRGGAGRGASRRYPREEAMTLKLHDLKPARGAKTARTRVGRGEGSKGKTAGRGTKGTKARKNVPVAFEGGQMPIHMRLPKLKGFRNRFRTEYEIVNVGDINRLFPQGGSIGVDELVAKGAVRKNSLVKVLGDGELTVKVEVSAHKFSGSAREKITAAGGSATEL